MKGPSKSLIPQQHEGEHTDVAQTVSFENIADARNFYLLAKERLKDVSNWHQISGPGSSKFQLTDAGGEPLYRMAEKGDHICIDLPGPGSSAGNGLEWVRIESIVEAKDAETEYIAITVRPVANPKGDDKSIANFYDHHSTNTFLVEQYQTQVSAAVHGRNEIPNNKETGIYDSVRNTIIALLARTGLSGPQWKKLVEGLLNTN